MPHIPKVEILCLGVGKGASYVMKGITSTAFTLLVDDVPHLQVDLGAGVARACLSMLGHIPTTIYVSHNHFDHTGDLEVAVHILDNVRVLGHPSVLEIVQQHRIHDAPATQRHSIERIQWDMPGADGRIQLDDDFALDLFQSQHRYVTYGFMLWHRNRLLLGYPADTGYDEDIYTRATEAPVAVLDGRSSGGSDHASFEEIDAFARRVPNCRILVVHYEQADHKFKSPNVQLWQPGDKVMLLNDELGESDV